MSERPDLLIVLCTIPEERARAFAEALVEARLAACVNAVPRVLSIYRWEGEMRAEEEAQLIIKTTSDRWEALAAFVQERHGYLVPELIALDVDRTLPLYAEWLRAETKGPRSVR